MRWGWAAFTVVWTGLVASTIGHNWIEEVTLVTSTDPNNKVPGKPRGYPAGGLNVDQVMVYENNRTDLDMPVCNHPDYGHYRDDEAKTQYPMFKASPGDWLWVKWKDNGHITKDPFDKSITGEGERAGKNPPYDQGKVWIYGSEKMDNVTYKDVASVSLKTVRSGSWKDGELLAESPYDDGLCAEENETLTFLERCKLGGGGPCKVAVQIPPSVKGTKYTLIYVWDYSGKLGRPAVMVHWFTSCLDIEILPGKKPTSTEKPPKITPARLVTQDEHLAHLQKGAKPSEAELVCKKKKLVKRSSIPGFSPSAKFRF